MTKYSRRRAGRLAEPWAETVGGLIGLAVVTWLAYKGLSIDFIRPFAITVLVVIYGTIIVIIVGVALASTPRKLSAAAETEVNPQIVENVLRLLEVKSKIKEIVDEHIETLARRRLMLVKVDHYGVVDGSGWKKEVQHFVDNVVRPKLSVTEAHVVGQKMNEIFQELIEDRVRIRADELESDLNFPKEITPLLFELWCSKRLKAQGWTAATTKASGDQGADIIAEKDGLRIVLQCKLYSSAVGNKAVQEAFAAQRHYATNASAVVSNAEFTRSAYELANTTGVLLIHYADLSRLDQLLSQKLGSKKVD